MCTRGRGLGDRAGWGGESQQGRNAIIQERLRVMKMRRTLGGAKLRLISPSHYLEWQYMKRVPLGPQVRRQHDAPSPVARQTIRQRSDWEKGKGKKIWYAFARSCCKGTPKPVGILTPQETSRRLFAHAPRLAPKMGFRAKGAARPQEP